MGRSQHGLCTVCKWRNQCTRNVLLFTITEVALLVGFFIFRDTGPVTMQRADIREPALNVSKTANLDQPPRHLVATLAPDQPPRHLVATLAPDQPPRQLIATLTQDQPPRQLIATLTQDQPPRQLIATFIERADACLYLNETIRALKGLSDQPSSRSECPEKNPSFFPTPLKNRHLTALASYPGSGNTWTRHVIEYISGIHTGSVYNSRLIVREFPGERVNDKRVITIKTHRGPGQDGIAYDNAILIIRRVREAVLSVYNLVRKGKTASVEQYEFKTKRWAYHVAKGTKAWEEMNLSWLTEYRGRLMVLSYTRLNEEFYGELCRLGGFLNVTISANKLRCSFEKREGKYHRKSTIDKSSIYTPVMLDAMNRAERKVEEAIAERFGYDATRGMF